jgi:threonyl-tRNA synthetase
MIENTYGRMPVWLSPIQVVIININKNNIRYINKLRKYFIEKNIRVKTDLRKQKVGFKIREHILDKIPYILIIGNKEEENNTVSLRIPEKKQILNMTLSYFFVKIRSDIKIFK